MSRSPGYGTIYTLKSNRRHVATIAQGQVQTSESDVCNFSGHLCRREKLQGHEYCLRHILEDKNSAYKQCNFLFKSQKRCPKAAPKTDKKDGFCLEHARSALIARQKVCIPQSPPDFQQKCLQRLGEYKRETVERKEVDLNSIGASSFKPDPQTLEPDGNNYLVQSQGLLNLTGSLSKPQDEDAVESDEEEITVETAWRGDCDSDAESVDSELENPLQHAGTYTSEEVIRIMRDKLIRLQKLYIDQFQRLRYILREERRAYRTSRKREHDAGLLPIDSQPRETIEELTAFQEVKSMAHYNKPHGLGAVLHAELCEKRLKMSESLSAISSLNHSLGNQGMPSTSSVGLGSSLNLLGSSGSSVKAKCSFNLTSSTKCGEVCVPISKFCIKHIMSDPNQVLFRACGINVTTEGDGSEDGPCETPIADIFDWSTCVYHTNFSQPVFRPKPEKVMKTTTEPETPNEVLVNGESSTPQPMKLE